MKLIFPFFHFSIFQKTFLTEIICLYPTNKAYPFIFSLSYPLFYLLLPIQFSFSHSIPLFPLPLLPLFVDLLSFKFYPSDPPFSYHIPSNNSHLHPHAINSSLFSLYFPSKYNFPVFLPPWKNLFPIDHPPLPLYFPLFPLVSITLSIINHSIPFKPLFSPFLPPAILF